MDKQPVGQVIDHDLRTRRSDYRTDDRSLGIQHVEPPLQAARYIDLVELLRDSYPLRIRADLDGRFFGPVPDIRAMQQIGHVDPQHLLALLVQSQRLDHARPVSLLLDLETVQVDHKALGRFRKPLEQCPGAARAEVVGAQGHDQFPCRRSQDQARGLVCRFGIGGQIQPAVDHAGIQVDPQRRGLDILPCTLGPKFNSHDVQKCLLRIQSQLQRRHTTFDPVHHLQVLEIDHLYQSVNAIGGIEPLVLSIQGEIIDRLICLLEDLTVVYDVACEENVPDHFGAAQINHAHGIGISHVEPLVLFVHHHGAGVAPNPTIPN